MKARRAHSDRTIPLRTALSRSAFAPTPNALEREWLVSNGLGGFACGSVAQANTRRYHLIRLVEREGLEPSTPAL
jgi:hypothetical protein